MLPASTYHWLALWRKTRALCSLSLSFSLHTFSFLWILIGRRSAVIAFFCAIIFPNCTYVDNGGSSGGSFPQSVSDCPFPVTRTPIMVLQWRSVTGSADPSATRYRTTLPASNSSPARAIYRTVQRRTRKEQHCIPNRNVCACLLWLRSRTSVHIS